VQYSDLVRNAKLDAIEQEIGTAPVLRLWGGDMPDRCRDQDEGRLLVTIRLPANWMEIARGGVKDKAGEWSTPRAENSGVATYFRIYDSQGICHVQGTVGIVEEVDMRVTIQDVAVGQPVMVERFTIVDGNS
jgi:hypothetical protein